MSMNDGEGSETGRPGHHPSDQGLKGANPHVSLVISSELPLQRQVRECPKGTDGLVFALPILYPCNQDMSLFALGTKG